VSAFLSQIHEGFAMKSQIYSPWRFVSMFFAFTFAIAVPNETHAAAPRPLRIAYLFTSGTMASMWMAKETGGFAKEGLDVEMISMSSVLALPALIANEVDVIQISAVPLINASLRGFDVVFIAGMLNTMIWDLYARPEIKSAEQLKGKIVGTDRPAARWRTAHWWRCAN
jgi:ABC-type nitrate/sulfonate/bicarbonate transport system substrate-binding protein